MSTAQLTVLLLKIAECFAAGATTFFIAEYSVFAPWWKDDVGRTIVWKDIALLQAFGLSILSLFFNFNRLTSEVAGFLGVFVIFEIGFVMCWRCYVWYKLHKKKPSLPGNEDV